MSGLKKLLARSKALIKNNMQKKFSIILAFFIALSVLVLPNGQYKIVKAKIIK